MFLRSRRSPVPHEEIQKNGGISPNIENGMSYLLASNVYSSKRLNIIIIILLFATFISLLNFYVLKQIENRPFGLHKDDELKFSPIQRPNIFDATKPIVWISGKRIEMGYLRHVIEVFEKIGFTKTFNESDGHWDVLWSHDYPFMNNSLGQLKPHQRVNHFPGSGFITNKVNLATSDLRHIPKAFTLPKEKDKFLDYAKENPEKLWVQKSNSHRGIKVEDISNLNLDSTGTFVQEYIQDPFLIDGKKFDIGIYTILTSVNPLRVYILESDALLRFCSKPYYPFNSTDLNSYVVGDDYTPTWEMKSLQKYFIELNLNMKNSFNAYLSSIGKDYRKVWQQMEDAIATVYIEKEDLMTKISSVFDSTRNFFEMVRFDFAVDEQLNVYLMEANMSPNLSSMHFGPNKLLYEQVIFNLLSLVGVARMVQVPYWNSRPYEYWNMMVSDKDLSVHEKMCTSPECHLSCISEKCNVCYHCLSDEFKMILKDAALEHLSRWNCKRIIPSTIDSDIKPKGEANKLQIEWFKGMCNRDKSYCS